MQIHWSSRCHLCNTDQEVADFIRKSTKSLAWRSRGGFKRTLMNWPFPFHLFLISVRTRLTFSATYQVFRPPCLSTASQAYSSSKWVLSPDCASVCVDSFCLTRARGVHVLFGEWISSLSHMDESDVTGSTSFRWLRVTSAMPSPVSSAKPLPL